MRALTSSAASTSAAAGWLTPMSVPTQSKMSRKKKTNRTVKNPDWDRMIKPGDVPSSGVKTGEVVRMERLPSWAFPYWVGVDVSKPSGMGVRVVPMVDSHQ